MIPAGKRNQRIVFERAKRVRNALGGIDVGPWSVVASRLAQVLYGTGAERRAGGAEGAIQAATFRVLADTVSRGVKAADRIVFDGLNWDITSVVPIGGPQAREIEFTATADRG